MAPRANYIVIVHEGEPIEGALKRLKNGLLKRGVFRDMQAHRDYLKPSLKKRLKSKRARAKVRKYESQMAEATAQRDERIERKKQFGRSIYVAPGGR